MEYESPTTSDICQGRLTIVVDLVRSCHWPVYLSLHPLFKSRHKQTSWSAPSLFSRSWRHCTTSRTALGHCTLHSWLILTSLTDFVTRIRTSILLMSLKTEIVTFITEVFDVKYPSRLKIKLRVRSVALFTENLNLHLLKTIVKFDFHFRSPQPDVLRTFIKISKFWLESTTKALCFLWSIPYTPL